MRLRRRLPAELRPAFSVFAQVVADVDRGKTALTGAVPSTRSAGRPLAEALLEFEEALAAADRNMPAWRRHEVAGAWEAAAAGLHIARDRAARARTDAPDPGGFEGLIGLIGDLLAPLDAFHDARDAFRSLGETRTSRGLKTIRRA